MRGSWNRIRTEARSEAARDMLQAAEGVLPAEITEEAPETGSTEAEATEAETTEADLTEAETSEAGIMGPEAVKAAQEGALAQAGPGTAAGSRRATACSGNRCSCRRVHLKKQITWIMK